VAYLGVLGPRQRTEGLLRHLGARATAQARGRLHAPAGLDLGAETSEEIALAIVAEIQAVFAGRAGGPLRERRGPIHDRPGSGLVDPEQGMGTQ
jgi:xanthine/CO dehydrogenase XdhC/CoxF family maturation factor